MPSADASTLRTVPPSAPTPAEVLTGPPSSRALEVTGHCRHLLVCLDRSAASKACVPHAVSLATTFGSAVTLAHVIPAAAGPLTNDAVGWEIQRQEARAYLERSQVELSAALHRPVAVRIEAGAPGERIVALAREISADVVVIGSHGEGGTQPETMGTTALQVLATTRSSLFIAQAGPLPPAEPRLRRILLPLDGSVRSESVLPVAARIAKASGAELLLVHVVQEPVPSALMPGRDEMDLARRLASCLASGAERYLEHIRQQLAHHAHVVRTLVVRRASQHQCLLELARSEAVDLIVVSAHGSACTPARSFGSVTSSLLAQTSVSLLTLQDLADDELSRGGDVDTSPAPVSPRSVHAAAIA